MMRKFLQKIAQSRKRIYGLLVLLAGTNVLFAQVTVTGTVTADADNSALPGVNVIVQGTSQGTVTDIDGNYTVEVAEDDILAFSFIGYITEEVPVNGRSVIDISLIEDITSLDEIVVVGYGTQSERTLTSAITTIESEDITRTPNSNPMQSLQGKVAGVQITSSGAPGSSPNVRVRGLSSFPGNDDSQPLYVVDGMFVDDIDFLNPADIESMTILKDAAASAIYGVRAANGVVLIETLSGDYEQPMQIVYDGYYGVQVPQNVVKMSNSEQYANYVNQVGNASEIALINNSITRFGRSRVNPNLPVTNTDWFKEVMVKAAPIQNHSLSITGGSEKVRYSVGASYFDQEGLIDHMRNDYRRTNLRVQVDAKATDWLTVGGNVNISNARQYAGDDAVWFQSYFAIPTLPVYDPLNTAADPVSYANAQQVGYRGTQNPFFVMDNNDNRNNIAKILGNFYAEFEIIPDKLTFNTSLNYLYNNIVNREVDFAYSNGFSDSQNGLKRKSSTDFNTIWDNLLTYKHYIDDHNFTVTAGYSFRSEILESVQAQAREIRTLDRYDESTWYIPKGSELNTDETFDDGARLFGASYFGRITYGFRNKYLLSGSYRRDGTNRFSKKWGNFFAVSGGWVISEESFFDIGGVDFLKLRAGWGQMGNDGINPAIGQTTFSQISVAIGDQLVTGVTPDNVFDLITTWEVTEETNVGINAEFLDNRLVLEADVYRRDTKDAVLNVVQSGTAESPRRNAGSIRNEGIELYLGWSDEISTDFSYNVSANWASLNNEVLSVGDQEFLNGGSAELRQISLVGSTLNEFYGYEIEGVFQNEGEVANSGYTDDFIANNNLQPGDFKFKDQNEDGAINSEDRVLLGSFIPSYTYGFTLGVNYKALSLSANFQGQGGNKILNRKRAEIIWTQDTNIDEDLASNFWTGEGTTNDYPSAAGFRKAYNNNQLNEFWLEDGDYFRVQNVRLAYQFVDKALLGLNMPETTISFTADRPLTVFQYNGFNPEVEDGVDRQTYPIPAVYTVGLNIKL